MHFDNPTLFNLLLVQALSSSLLLLLLMGLRASPAARWAQAFMGLQAVAWLALAAVEQGSARVWQTLAMAAFSASLSALWWSLRLWLKPQPGRALALLAPLLMPLVYGLQFDDASFRVAWAQFWLALQLALLMVALIWPAKQEAAPRALSDALPNTVPGVDNRHWRMMLLLACAPALVVCVLRGILGAYGKALPSLLSADAINTTLGLASHWGLSLALLALVLAWRAETESELARLAQTDGLTGLPDSRAFAARSVDMLSMARRHQEPLAMLILDIDGLKAINTEHGTQAGDRAMALFASSIQAQMRLGDLAGRISRDQFGLLMSRCEAEGPQAMDKRMRQALAERAPTELGFALNFSAGWAKLRFGDRNIDDLMLRAETALYEAKRAGHGRLQAEPGLEG
ncbi:GGDEF domain-containing protein [Paucibacter sp. AS339]|uniref:GGDEF domain-containing protein n=1 Tax=Paucibacter hankyongi TaxID=3133434 RepID=UPI00309B8814